MASSLRLAALALASLATHVVAGDATYQLRTVAGSYLEICLANPECLAGPNDLCPIGELESLGAPTYLFLCALLRMTANADPYLLRY